MKPVARSRALSSRAETNYANNPASVPIGFGGLVGVCMFVIVCCVLVAIALHDYALKSVEDSRVQTDIALDVYLHDHPLAPRPPHNHSLPYLFFHISPTAYYIRL
jgi:hypothetical protein